ncbi:HD-GYP domain-containing protein [Cytobacillus sp. FJAT-54145]|uniref:HD-GYP domain-containing protein n=1 Tax=Cytobacillus spartinae TaxID=3299023 RepID=A0ABW6KET2_9BACI
MKMYRQFLRNLLWNYTIGSLLAVFGVGGTFIFSFSTLEVIPEEKSLLFFIMLGSVLCMFMFEGLYFYKHLKPIRELLLHTNPNHEVIERGLKELYRFPVNSVKRIMLPHFLGLSIPAAITTIVLIQANKLHIPNLYVVYALIAAFSVAVLHALIEYYLTVQAIQPVSLYIKSNLQSQDEFLFLENELLIPISRKFKVTVILIGILPIFLFLLAAQVKLSDLTGMEMTIYWQWAGVILLFTIIYAFLTAKYLSKDIEKPIRQLQEAMSNVQNQNYEYVRVNVYSDEFSQVFSGFNHMIQAIKTREETNKQLLESFMAALSITLDARDPYTSGHSMRVASFSYELGRNLGMSKEELEQLYQTALLHDIGKVGVPDHVLLKDGKLTEEEFQYIKAHPVIGENILKQVQPANQVIGLLPGIRTHHERMDGKGYPDGLMGEEIPLVGRIIAVADGFDAMTSDRPYRKGMSVEKALEILTEGRGTQWDSKIVNEFVKIIMAKRELLDIKQNAG